MTVSIPWQKDVWVDVKYENKWHPGFMKKVTENILFADLVTVINVCTYYKYLELLVENYGVRFLGTFSYNNYKTF